MKRDKHAIKPKTSARPAKTKKLNMPPKAVSLCVVCAQPTQIGAHRRAVCVVKMVDDAMATQDYRDDTPFEEVSDGYRNDTGGRESVPR